MYRAYTLKTMLIYKKLTLELASPNGELDLPALGGGPHHADHNVVGGAHHGLVVHCHDLVAGVQPAVHIRRATRYYVTDGHLK